MKILKHILFFFLAFNLFSCATHNQQEDQATAFKKFWNPVLDKAMDTSPENSSRIRAEGSALVVEGSFIDGDCERVKAKLEGFVADKVIVNSQGGIVSQGLCIAKALSAKGINKVIVRGVCWSSCANYLFLGMKDRIIERGVVGFHGNNAALLKKEGVFDLVKKAEEGKNLSINERISFRTFISKPKSSKFLTAEETDILKKMISTYKQERTFFEELKISQHFFDMTQQPDKGEGSGTPYLFLMPSAAYMARELKIQVQGDQDLDFIKKANLKFPVGLLYKN